MFQISTARPVLSRPTCANTLKKTPKDSPHIFCKKNPDPLKLMKQVLRHSETVKLT